MAVTPIRRQMSVVNAAPQAQMPVPAAAPSQQGWVWNGSNWVWDPDCCVPPWWGQFPPQPCPPFVCNFPPQCPPVPPSPLPPPPLTGPIVGVTDGSSAAPGQVGEFVTGSASGSYAAGVETILAMSPIIIQPGDWDIWSYATPSTPIGQLGYFLSPLPTGLSGPLDGSFWSDGNFAGIVRGLQARGSFTVPTLLAFSMHIEQQTTTPPGGAGTVTLTVNARRVR